MDEPACRLLVENLALTHREDVVESATSNQDGGGEGFYSDATLVADFYSSFVSGPKVEQSGRTSPVPPSMRQHRRGSHSSIVSQASSLSFPASSIGLPQRARALSSESFELSTTNNSATGSNDNNDGGESDSGDDEEVAISTSLSRESSAVVGKEDGGASSSSGEEDEEEVILATTRSHDDDLSSQRSTTPVPFDYRSDVFKQTYPVKQEQGKYKRVRQRYFGRNLEHAHSAIASSLQYRLDVKSKQNSGLLQSLPLFTSLPPVRTLISANLEKWLQSPALAGLARNLFSTTVSMMKNVDPPLPADLEAIDNILAMRLKSNQVRFLPFQAVFVYLSDCMSHTWFL